MCFQEIIHAAKVTEKTESHREKTFTERKRREMEKEKKGVAESLDKQQTAQVKTSTCLVSILNIQSSFTKTHLHLHADVASLDTPGLFFFPLEYFCTSSSC